MFNFSRLTKTANLLLPLRDARRVITRLGSSHVMPRWLSRSPVLSLQMTVPFTVFTLSIAGE